MPNSPEPKPIMVIGGWGFDADSLSTALSPLKAEFSAAYRFEMISFSDALAQASDEHFSASLLNAKAVIGWSAGGVLAQEIFLKNQIEVGSEIDLSRLPQLVLVSSTLEFCHPETGTPPKVLRAMQLGLRKAPEEVLNAFASLCGLCESSDIRLQATDPDALKAGLSFLAESNLSQSLPLLPAPLVVHGGQDKVIGLAAGERLAAHHNASLAVIPEATHCLIIEHAKELAKLIRSRLVESS